jgi:hypothetical protein
MKPKAREAFISQLKKEKLYELGLIVEDLNDKELKTLHNNFMWFQQGCCSYHVPKKEDFSACLESGRLQYVSFRGTPGVRRMTFAEYLQFLTFKESNPTMYRKYFKLDKECDILL